MKEKLVGVAYSFCLIVDFGAKSKLETFGRNAFYGGSECFSK